MLDEPEVIRQQMHETRSALTEKLETLEHHVVDTVAEAQSAVVETVENVKEAVQETVDVVKGSVQEGVESVRKAFDLPHQVSEYPWLFVGGSVALGFLCGRMMHREDHYRPGFASSDGRQTNGASGYTPRGFVAETNRPRTPEHNWLSSLAESFSGEIDKVKSLAIGMGIGAVRDMITQAVPDQLRPRLTEIMNDITAKMGGETIREPILSPANDVCSRAARTTHPV